jgi:hydrogenase-4 component E
VTNILIILLGTTMLYVSAVSRVEAYVKTLAFQGFILFLLVIFDIKEINWLNIAFLILETLVIKTFAIPYFLLTVIRKNEIDREIEPYISQFYSLLISSGIFIFGFIVAFWSARTGSEIKPLYFGISVVMIILSLFLIVNRKRIITHILCYMMLENGIFLLSLSVANELPMLVNLGVLLDLFVVVYLFAIFFNKIHEIYDGSHVDVLTDLKDE